MPPVEALFAGPQMTAGTCVYLKWDRYSALADFIVRSAGTLDVPVTFTVPGARFLPDTMPAHPRGHDKYYSEGGAHAPDRWVVSVNGAAE